MIMMKDVADKQKAPTSILRVQIDPTKPLGIRLLMKPVKLLLRGTDAIRKVLFVAEISTNAQKCLMKTANLAITHLNDEQLYDDNGTVPAKSFAEKIKALSKIGKPCTITFASKEWFMCTWSNAFSVQKEYQQQEVNNKKQEVKPQAKETVRRAIKERSDSFRFSNDELNEGWLLNPISQRIRIARSFTTKTKYASYKKILLCTVVGTLLYDDGILFMNLHDDGDRETIDYEELEEGKILYKDYLKKKQDKQKYSIGYQIDCKYRSSKGRYYPGQIKSYDPMDERYTVLYDDGEEDINVKEDRIRERK